MEIWKHLGLFWFFELQKIPKKLCTHYMSAQNFRFTFKSVCGPRKWHNTLSGPHSQYFTYLLLQYTLTYTIIQCVVYVSVSTYNSCNEDAVLVFESYIAENSIFNILLWVISALSYLQVFDVLNTRSGCCTKSCGCF